MKLIRMLLVVGYVALCVLAFVEPQTPRIFWTMAMPAIPLVVVVLGFGTWRRLCPLAFIAALGARGSNSRLPRWIQRRSFTLSLVMLYAALVIRLLATNGDGAALGIFLASLALFAIVVNAIGSGKSWCNHVCPVGLVERIYTDPGPIAVTTASSQCTPCSGCKRSCPDIDPERAYRNRLAADRDRRIAFYAFPGLVLSFYACYWLHEGEWAAFFDGRWTRHAPSLSAVGSSGLAIAVVAPVTLALGAIASVAAFAALERCWSQRHASRALVRHRVLALSGFVAFNLFYWFAGAPALMGVPGLTALVAFVVPVVACLMLLRSAVRVVREEPQPAKEIMTDKSSKILEAVRWPAPCSATSDASGRRRVALVVLH